MSAMVTTFEYLKQIFVQQQMPVSPAAECNSCPHCRLSFKLQNNYKQLFEQSPKYLQMVSKELCLPFVKMKERTTGTKPDQWLLILQQSISIIKIEKFDDSIIIIFSSLANIKLISVKICRERLWVYAPTKGNGANLICASISTYQHQAGTTWGNSSQANLIQNYFHVARILTFCNKKLHISTFCDNK